MVKGKDYIGVGVGAFVLNDKNELLLLKRNSGAEKGTWSIPGGSVEFNETIEAAVIREIKEEVNLDIKVIKLLTIVNHIIPTEKVHWVSVEFLCEIIGGELKNMEPLKHTDMRWFNISDFPENISIITQKGLEHLNEFLLKNQ